MWTPAAKSLVDDAAWICECNQGAGADCEMRGYAKVGKGADSAQVEW